MSDDAIGEPIRLALNIADAALAERLAAVLASVPGLELVDGAETADAVILLPIASSSDCNSDLQLTPREAEVLALLAEGASNKVIAHTAKFHVGAVIDKLDAIGRTDAVAQAVRLHIINL